MTTIFISHSSRDDEFVDKLTEELKQHEFDTWVDHKNTPEGMLWANSVQDGLEKGEHMILLITEQSMQSRHVRIEWQSFQGLVKPIILLLLSENVDIPKLLQDYPTVNWSASLKDFQKNIADLLKYLPSALPPVIEKASELPQTRQLNPNAVGLNELQRLAGEAEGTSTPGDGSSEIKLVIPKSDITVKYRITHPMRIGRGSPHDVKRPDIDLNSYESIKTVSRNHATISVQNGVVVLTDNGSSNGTFVSGKRLKPNMPTKIESGTMVRFGALIVQIMQGK